MKVYKQFLYMKNYIVAKHSVKQFNDKYFLTTDMGRSCTLTEKEYNFFRKEYFNKETEKKLLYAGVILSNTNIQECIDVTNKREDVIFAGTSLHIIVVTLRCNMSCKYCQVGRQYYDKGSEYDMSIETARHTVDRIFETPNDDIIIELQGGEPTLNWDTLKFIVEYSKKKKEETGKNSEITMVTNMSTMTEERMNYLIDCNVDVCTSLDGPAIVHNFNRKYNKDNHSEVIKWIHKFNEEYKTREMDTRMSALVTLTRESLKYPKEIIQQYIDLNIEVIHLRRLTKLGFAKIMWDKISYTTEEYLKFWLDAVEYIYKLQQEGKYINERMVLMMEEKIREDKDINYFDLRNPCGAGIGQLAYNYDGNVYSCDEARMIKKDIFKLGNVKTNKYMDFIKNKKCAALVQASTLNQFKCCNECVYSPYCGICPVLNYEYDGKLTVIPTETDMCKIQKTQFDWVVKRYFLRLKMRTFI